VSLYPIAVQHYDTLSCLVSASLVTLLSKSCAGRGPDSALSRRQVGGVRVSSSSFAFVGRAGTAARNDMHGPRSRGRQALPPRRRSARGSGIWPRRIPESPARLGQKTRRNPRTAGHSEGGRTAQGRCSQRRWSAVPSQASPDETTMSRCQPSQRGDQEHRHTDRPRPAARWRWSGRHPRFPCPRVADRGSSRMRVCVPAGRPRPGGCLTPRRRTAVQGHSRAACN